MQRPSGSDRGLLPDCSSTAWRDWQRPASDIQATGTRPIRMLYQLALAWYRLHLKASNNMSIDEEARLSGPVRCVAPSLLLLTDIPPRRVPTTRLCECLVPSGLGHSPPPRRLFGTEAPTGRSGVSFELTSPRVVRRVHFGPPPRAGGLVLNQDFDRLR